MCSFCDEVLIALSGGGIATTINKRTVWISRSWYKPKVEHTSKP